MNINLINPKNISPKALKSKKKCNFNPKYKLYPKTNSPHKYEILDSIKDKLSLNSRPKSIKLVKKEILNKK